jgi:hypothetical protein
MLNILPSTYRSSKLSLFYNWLAINLVFMYRLCHTCYMLRLSHPRFQHPNDIGVQYQPWNYPLPVFLSLLLIYFLSGTDTFFNNVFSNSSLPLYESSFHTYSTADRILVLHILMTILARVGKKWRKKEEEDVSSYWITVRKRDDTVRGRSRLRFLENSLWKRPYLL